MNRDLLLNKISKEMIEDNEMLEELYKQIKEIKSHKEVD